MVKGGIYYCDLTDLDMTESDPQEIAGISAAVNRTRGKITYVIATVGVGQIITIPVSRNDSNADVIFKITLYDDSNGMLIAADLVIDETDDTVTIEHLNTFTADSE